MSYICGYIRVTTSNSMIYALSFVILQYSQNFEIGKSMESTYWNVRYIIVGQITETQYNKTIV